MMMEGKRVLDIGEDLDEGNDRTGLDWKCILIPPVGFSI
jgi:hypothetical protein